MTKSYKSYKIWLNLLNNDIKFLNISYFYLNIYTKRPANTGIFFDHFGIDFSSNNRSDINSNRKIIGLI